MTSSKAIALFVTFHLLVTLDFGTGMEVDFIINSTTTQDQDMTCSIDGTGAQSKIEGILQMEIISIMENSEERLATINVISQQIVQPGQTQMVHSFGTISGKEGVLRLKMKANKNVLKYSCRVMALDRKHKAIIVEKQLLNKANVLMSILNQRFAGIASGMDLSDAFQKLEDKLEETQNTVEDKMSANTEAVTELSERILISEGILNNSKKSVTEVFNSVQSNEGRVEKVFEKISEIDDRVKTSEKKIETVTTLLESLVNETRNGFAKLEKTVNPTDFIKDHETQETFQSCEQFRNSKANTSSRVIITTDDFVSLMCDTTTNGGGWIVFQRRMNGDLDFFRTWQDYADGFGNFGPNFWLGLNRLSSLVATGHWELRVDFEHEGKPYYAEYFHFRIGDSSTDFRLSVSGYSGTAGDDLSPHNDMRFSTKDRDNDKNSGNCAQSYTGAWWYNSCHNSNLNGGYGVKGSKGIHWHKTTKFNVSATFTEMKIRRVR